MKPLLALILLVNLALAHLPSTPVNLRRSAAHKRRLDDAYLSPALALRRRDLIPGDGITTLGQTPDGLIIAVINGVTTTLPASPSSSSSSSSPPPDTSTSSTPSDTSSSSTPSDTSTSSESPTSTSSSSSPDALSDSSSSTTPSSSVPPSSTYSSDSSPTPSSSDPASSTDSCGLLGLGILCLPSSTPTPSSTDSSSSLSTSDTPNTSTTSDLSQSTQPPSTTGTTSTTGALCSLLGVDCPSSSTSVSSDTVSTPPSSQTNPPASTTDIPSSSSSGDLCALLGVGCPSSSTFSSDSVSTQPTPTNSGTVTTQPPPSSSSVDSCSLLGIGCSSSSTPTGSDTVSSQPSQTPSTSDTPLLSTSGDVCAMFGIGCSSSSTPVSSNVLSTQSPPASTDPLSTQPPSSSSSGDLCASLGIGCPSSTLVSSGLVSLTSLFSSEPSGSTQLSINTGVSSLTSLPSSSEPTGSTQFLSSDSLSATGSSLSPGSSSSFSSGISFPSGSPSLSSSSTLDSESTTPSTSLPPPPSNTQFQWLTQSSLIFSSVSQSTESMSLTDPDQVPTPTSFSTTGTPTAVPSIVSLPSGIPARIVPGSGGVDPSVDDLNGFTLIAILFDQGLNWETVVQNPDSPGQIFAWLPVLIQTSLGITADQVKSFALQVWVPITYQDPKDASLLGTTWLGYVPTGFVDTLASQIKTKTSPFYTDLASPYSDLADHVDPAFDIMTVTNTTGLPGSGGSSSSSSGATSSDSRTRENAIIGVVSALGGITLIILGCLIYRALQKRRELAHRRLSDPPANPFIGEAPPDRNFDQDSIGGQRRRSFYFAEDSLRGFSDYSNTNDGARLSPEQTSGLNRRPIAGNIGPPVMRENSLNF